MSSRVSEQLYSLVEPVCRAHGVELVEASLQREKGGTVLRVMIDRSRADEIDGSAVTLEDCTEVSRDVSTVLDVHGEILPTGAFRLEVTSPGLERPLTRRADFERFRGRTVKIKTKVPVGDRRSFSGRLEGIEEDEVAVDIEGARFRIPYESIAKAHLVPQL